MLIKTDNVLFICFTILITTIFGCSNVTSNAHSQTANKFVAISPKSDVIATKSHQDAMQKDDFWYDVQKNFKIADYDSASDNRLVNHYISQYTKNSAHNLSRLINKSTPYLYHVAKELEKRDMPTDLIFLPMIESAYDSHAKSNQGALGLWQLARVTADRFGVTFDNWYDGRKDPHESTDAALDYLQFLYETFDNDWLLALAAYNSGEGRVKQAIRRNKKEGLPIGFWDLKLPKQTIHHVPKLLAIAHIVKNNHLYPLELPIIQNKPQFKKVDLDKQIDLLVISRLSKVPVSEIKKLNPGHKKHATHPERPHHITLPFDSALGFESKLANLDECEYIASKLHTIKHGDNLSTLAANNHTSVSEIIKLNKLKNETIVVGKEILIPVGRVKIKPDMSGYHLVKAGDNLISIAKENNTTVKKLMTLNNLKDHNIIIGKKLVIV